MNVSSDSCYWADFVSISCLAPSSPASAYVSALTCFQNIFSHASPLLSILNLEMAYIQHCSSDGELINLVIENHCVLYIVTMISSVCTVHLTISVANEHPKHVKDRNLAKLMWDWLAQLSSTAILFGIPEDINRSTSAASRYGQVKTTSKALAFHPAA